jgi:hypothetical protein
MQVSSSSHQCRGRLGAVPRGSEPLGMQVSSSSL